MKNRIAAHPAHTLLFILMALLFGNGLRAQITYDNFLPKSDIFSGALLTVNDPDTTQTGPGVFVNRTQYLSLVYTTEAQTDVQNYTAWSYGVVVKIMNGADTTQYFTDTLNIRRNDSLPQYQALNHYTLPWYSLHIRVLTVCGKAGTDTSCVSNPHLYPLLPEDIELQAGIIRTQINGFTPLLDIPSGPVEYDEGEVLESCEEQYNKRLTQLQQQHDALATQRLEDYMGSLGTNVQSMEDLNEAILAQTLTEMNRLVDTLTHADSLYYYQCDSLPIDTAHLSQLRAVGQNAFLNHFYTPYFNGFNNRGQEIYLGSQTYAQAYADDSTRFVNHVFDGFDHWGANTVNEVWSLYPPGTGACVMAHFGDTAAHWSERILDIINDMYSVRKTVLDDENVPDSLYMLYQGAKQTISIQTHSEYTAAVNALNEEMLTYCGYTGSPMGDCNSFYEGLINANKAYMAHVIDSVADTVATLYGLAPDMLGEPNPSVTSAINGLLTEYNNNLHTLDLQWATCAADSLQADSILAVLQAIGTASNYLPSQFLASREGSIQNQYQSLGTLPNLGEWQTLTGNLLNTYQNEGKDLALEKQAAIHNQWPALDGCISTLYLAHENGSKAAITHLLSQIDSTFDTLNVYGSSSSYTYEMALARWMVDYENSPDYIAAVAKMDSLITEKNENCGSGSTPAPESYLACLARTEAELQNLYHGRNTLLAGLDGLTETFRGIARPGGWNDANADILQLLDPLLGEYRYKMDSLAVAVVGPCILDSVRHQQFMDLSGYNPLWEQNYFYQTFIPAYHALFPEVDYDIQDYVTNNYDSLSDELSEVYGQYWGQRINERFFTRMPSLNLDSSEIACVESFGPMFETEFGNLQSSFLSQMDLYLEAGAVGITPNDSGYRESVLYYSLLRAAINKTYWRFFEQANQARLNCSSVLKNAEVSVPDDPEPPTPSIEAEIAACQTEVESRFNQLGPVFQANKVAILELAFASEMANGMNITPLNISIEDSITLRQHRSLDTADSLWLGCNTAPSVLNILAAVFDSDVFIAALFETQPAYVTDAELLYVGGNTNLPDYSHVNEFSAMDSLLYMALAERRPEWMVEKIQEQPGTYGVADSCIIHHETDSTTEAQYAATYTNFQNELQNYLNSFKPLYDTSTINPDTLELKLRWVYAARTRQTYLYLQQYVALLQEYDACEDLRSQLIVWKAERDPALNQPKKGIGTKFPIKPVGTFPLLPITPNVMDLTTSTVTVVTESGPCGNVRYLEWTPITNAVEYDLEWAYIDSLVYLEGAPANQHADIAYRAFSLTEPTRVTVKENRFPFPGEYPNGKLYFRVRGVARVIDVDHQSYYQPQFFPWIFNWSGYAVSNADVNFNGTNPFNNQYENNLNWQWEASFAEEGKFKRVISYHDGLNRPHQVVTHLSTDNLSVIGETLYDHEGRAAVQILPYPEPCYELSYRDETRSDSAGGDFDKEDFELTAGNERMATEYGASQYYSVENPFMAVENPLMHTGSIPDAGKYPYTQTAFLLDNTGRPTRSGGVGADHTLNGEHATRYYYANASETELRRLFGKNVGLASHYKKNAVMDANGQLSIAYVDQEGRSVATALAGLSPDNVLPLESNQPFIFTQNLTGNNIHDPVEGEWNISYNQLNEIPENEYTFTYQYGLDRLFEGTTPPCIVCEFDLEIYITDPDGNRLPLIEIMDGDSTVADTNYFYKRLDATAYELADPCSTLLQLREVTFTVTLPEVNTYTIHKNLRWDKDAALADIWAASQPEVNSYTASVQTSILNTYISQINYDECEQMFPGTGFGAIPDDILDHTDSLATTSQCQSYLTQMIDQITPYAGPVPSPSTEYPQTGSPIVNSGIYGNDSTFWATVTDLMSDGLAQPSNPEYIAPSSWAPYINGIASVSTMVAHLKANPGQWSTELKRELVKAHPEYCWYKKCLVYATAVPYDADMAQQTNLTNGRPYRNPLVGSEDLDPFVDSGTLLPDPLNGTDEDAVISEEAINNDPGGSTTIWGNANTISSNNISNSGLSTDELAWQTYRGGYLQAKSDAFYTETGGCPFLDTETAIVVKPDLPETEEEMANSNSANQNAWEAAEPCEDICRQNALAWTAQMFTNCGETGDSIELEGYIAAKEDIVEHLRLYCIDNCGEANPMGIITEQMFADAMEQGSGHLWAAIQAFNNNFANVDGCDPITGTTTIHGTDTVTTWNPTFTYSEGEYTEICDTFGVLVRTEDIQAWVNRINNAYSNMDSPEDPFIIPHFYGNLNSLVSTSCYLEDIASLNHIPLEIIPCEEQGPRDCGIIFMEDTVPTFINMTEVRSVSLPPNALANVEYGPHGVLVPAIFEIWDIDEHPLTGDLLYDNFAYNINGFLRINFANCCNKTICRIFPNGWTENIDPGSLIDTCEKFLLEEAHQNAANAFDNWLQNYVDSLWQQTNCGIAEAMKCSYTKSEHHYTLYYYDQAANLVQTVPPKGVHPLDVNNPVHFGANGHWPGSTPTNPLHDMESRYKFNSLEVAIESETPDGGFTKYTPDAMGRPMQSRNAEQRKRAAALGSGIDIFSYTNYDNLGRITAVAEIWSGYTPPVGLPIYQTTSTKYDTPVEIGQIGWKSENTRARVSSVQYMEENVLRHAVFYSYDIHGNVKSMVTQVPALKNFGQEFHRIDYYYDLVSGKVNEVQYQPKSPDRFFHRYQYDSDNRLVNAETSRDYINWERDAKYFYYPHGPLKRVETGHRKVQGTDYFYTIHGWLKGVNAGALNETYDVGRDGDRALSGNPNGLVARDAYGFTLDYYNGDYKAIGTTNMNHIPYISGTDYENAALENGLYNGNIARMATALLRPNEQRLPVLGFAYQYDQLNRIRNNRSFTGSNLHSTNSWASVAGTDAYKGTYTYDANGNILSLQRHDATGTLRDNFTTYDYTDKNAYTGLGDFYNYKGPQNRLNHIVDSVDTDEFPDDMDTQAADNYGYDEIGNLVKDAAEEIDKIEWTVYGKVKSVKRETGSKKPDLYFYYTGSGQRYMKVVIPKNQTTGAPLGKHEWKASYYQHDAQGNIMAIYEIKGGPGNCGYDMFLGEHVLYGSSRLGVATYDKYLLGNTDKSLAYPSVQEIYVCYAEADDTNLPFEPLGDTPTGPIGGNWEVIKPYGTHKVPQFTMPITGVNLPWTPGVITADPMPVTPTKEPTAYVPGFKRYEFSNHLGNVLVTISDVPLGVDAGNDGNVDYYMPDVKTTSDYEPFGAPLLERTFGPEICSTYTEITDTTDVGVITDAFGTAYVPNNTASSSVWYRYTTASFANVTGGSLRIAYTGGGSGIRAAARRFTAVTGKSYSLTLTAARVAGASDNTLKIHIVRVSDGVTVYSSGTYALPSSGASISVSLPGFFTAPDNAQYILVLERPGGNNNAAIIDDLSFTYAEPVYTTFTDCHNDPEKGYRFGFNGQMKDDEVYGEGNAYTADFWEYDPRIGRRWNIDPVVKVSLSPYSALNNNPIILADFQGNDAEIPDELGGPGDSTNPGGGGPGDPKSQSTLTLNQSGDIMKRLGVTDPVILGFFSKRVEGYGQKAQYYADKGTLRMSASIGYGYKVEARFGPIANIEAGYKIASVKMTLDPNPKKIMSVEVTGLEVGLTGEVLKATSITIATKAGVYTGSYSQLGGFTGDTQLLGADFGATFQNLKWNLGPLIGTGPRESRNYDEYGLGVEAGVVGADVSITPKGFINALGNWFSMFGAYLDYQIKATISQDPKVKGVPNNK